MRQRVMIALALACKPELIIGDEPTTALDVMMQAQILELLEELRRELGLAMILITHDLSVLAETCDRVAIMYAGQIAEVGPVRDLYALAAAPVHAAAAGGVPGHRRAARAGAGDPRRAAGSGRAAARLPFAPRCHRVAERCVAERARAAARSPTTGSCAATSRPGPTGGRRHERRRRTPVTTPLFEVRDLKVHFPIHRSGGRVVKAIDGVDLEWRRGEVLGIVGESGCGKSTLGRTLLGLQPPDGGRDPRRRPAARRADLRAVRRRVQMIFQDPYQSLNPRQTVGALVMEPLAIHGIGARRRSASRAPSRRWRRPGWHRPRATGTGTRTSCRAASASAS